MSYGNRTLPDSRESGDEATWRYGARHSKTDIQLAIN